MSRYNRIEDLQFGKDREIFDLVMDSDAADTQLARDSAKHMYREGRGYAQLAMDVINGHSEEEREFLEGEDWIGARIY